MRVPDKELAEMCAAIREDLAEIDALLAPVPHGTAKKIEGHMRNIADHLTEGFGEYVGRCVVCDLPLHDSGDYAIVDEDGEIVSCRGCLDAAIDMFTEVEEAGPVSEQKPILVECSGCRELRHVDHVQTVTIHASSIPGASSGEIRVCNQCMSETDMAITGDGGGDGAQT